MPIDKVIPPVTPCLCDGVFYDTHGNVVGHGSIILIEKTYSLHHLHNRKAVVEWSHTKGMYHYRMIDQLYYPGSSFYGIHSFKLVTDAD